MKKYMFGLIAVPTMVLSGVLFTSYEVNADTKNSSTNAVTAQPVAAKPSAKVTSVFMTPITAVIHQINEKQVGTFVPAKTSTNIETGAQVPSTLWDQAEIDAGAFPLSNFKTMQIPTSPVSGGAKTPATLFQADVLTYLKDDGTKESMVVARDTPQSNTPDHAAKTQTLFDAQTLWSAKGVKASLNNFGAAAKQKALDIYDDAKYNAGQLKEKAVDKIHGAQEAVGGAIYNAYAASLEATTGLKLPRY